MGKKKSSKHRITVPRDSALVIDKLQDLAKKANDKDERLQFVLPQSFAFTEEQRAIADKWGLKLNHHVHDIILYRMYVEDIHICVMVLRSALARCGTYIGSNIDFNVLAKSIDDIYSPFLRSYSSPDCSTLKDTLFLVKEAAFIGMHSPWANAFFTCANLVQLFISKGFTMSL